jgi:hypothetical protein
VSVSERIPYECKRCGCCVTEDDVVREDGFADIVEMVRDWLCLGCHQDDRLLGDAVAEGG